jgi:hypothetical protein
MCVKLLLFDSKQISIAENHVRFQGYIPVSPAVVCFNMDVYTDFSLYIRALL